MGQYAGTKRSLIKFNVSAIPSTATVTSAKLRMLDVRGRCQPHRGGLPGPAALDEARQHLEQLRHQPGLDHGRLRWFRHRSGRHAERHRLGNDRPDRHVGGNPADARPGAGLGQRHDLQLWPAPEGHRRGQFRDALLARELHRPPRGHRQPAADGCRLRQRPDQPGRLQHQQLKPPPPPTPAAASPSCPPTRTRSTRTPW